MIGAFVTSAAPDRHLGLDPGLLRYRDRACLRLLYRTDVATTSQLVTLVYRRRQIAQKRLAALHRLGYLDRAVLPPTNRGGAPLAFRLSARARRRLGWHPLTRLRAGTQLRHSLNVVETVCALVRTSAPPIEPVVQLWYPECNATALLPSVYPDSVVVLQAAGGSAALCLEIDEATEHGPQLRAKLVRYADALPGRAGWHALFVAPTLERVEFLARLARRNGGHPGLRGRAWALVLAELAETGLAATVVPLFAGAPRTTLREVVCDPRARRCPTPVATDAWLRVLAYGADEDTAEALA